MPSVPCNFQDERCELLQQNSDDTNPSKGFSKIVFKCPFQIHWRNSAQCLELMASGGSHETSFTLIHCQPLEVSMKLEKIWFNTMRCFLKQKKSFQTSDSFAGPFRDAVYYSLAEHEPEGRKHKLINNTFSAASD